MTKKDYDLIGSVIANRFSKVDQWQSGSEKIHTLTEIVTIAEDFVKALKASNPRFDRVKFISSINTMRLDGGKLLV